VRALVLFWPFSDLAIIKQRSKQGNSSNSQQQSTSKQISKKCSARLADGKIKTSLGFRSLKLARWKSSLDVARI
jgi:hypothetical protein